MRKIFTLAASFLLTLSAFCVPAKQTPIKITQPDGTEITVYLKGDEFHHYYTTIDGLPIYRGEDNYFRYIMSDGVTVSKCIARNPEERTAEDLQAISSTNPKALIKKFNDINTENRLERTKNIKRKALNNTKTGEDSHGLIILVNFSDIKFTKKKEDFENLMNQNGYSENGSIGSARDYFIDQSNGQFKPVFDIVGPVDLPHDVKYYGGNTPSDDYHVAEMIVDACKEAEKLGTVDFSKYDSNGDKELDLVYVIYAGYSEAAGAPSYTVWPHSWAIKNGAQMTEYVDGYLINYYACSSELTGTRGTNIDGIGTFCHEFSHTLGLPDFYNTVNSSDFTMSNWSLMDYGCYNNNGYVPVGYSAYEREFVGWMKIKELDNTPRTITLENVANTLEAYKVVSNNPNEYFILETRVKDKWDKYMDAEGLMITSIAYNKNDWDSNTLNNGSKKRVFVVAADNSYSEYTLSGDLYPYKTNNSFTDTSKPASRTYSGYSIGKPITEITKNADKTITFNILGGEGNTIAAPVALPATDITATSFVANWEPSEGADKYTLYLFDKSSGEEVKYDEYNTKDTSYKISLLPENGSFSYYVKALKDGITSEASNTIEVQLTSGIEDYNANMTSVYAQGKQIIVNTDKDTTVKVFHISGSKVMQSTIPAGTYSFEINEAGMYIVQCMDKVFKVQVR